MRAILGLLLLAAAVLLAPQAASAQPARPVLAFPLACQIGQTCEVQNYVDRDPGPGAFDYRCRAETYQGHNGVDIRLPNLAAMRRGVAVLAPAAGRVVRLRDGEPDRSVREAAFTPGRDCGNAVAIDLGGGWEVMACHLKRGSLKVKVGDTVKPGQPIAEVGLSGNTEYPHLHLTVFKDRAVVDPFAPDASGRASCAAARPLWSPAALAALGYKAGAVLNAGFATGPVDLGGLDAGVAAPGRGAPAVVAYVRSINLQAGDRVELALTTPAGAAKPQVLTVPRKFAQHLIFTGTSRVVPGAYRAEFRVLRAGQTVLTRRFETTIP